MNQDDAIDILGINGPSIAGGVPEMVADKLNLVAATKTAVSVDADVSGKRKRSHNSTISNNTNASLIKHTAATNNNTSSTNNEEPIKTTRINWAKSPHREYLSQVLHDWSSQTGLAIDTTTSEPITDYKIYAEKVGISQRSLFNYTRKDPSKRRRINQNASRGKKRLIDKEGIQLIVAKLKAKADV